MKIGNVEGFVQTNESKVLETNKFSMALTSKAFDAVISTLYSDRIMAVVREYSTNAYEAHQYSDIEHIPFDVICPTSSNPTFVVRDYGPGMSRDKISCEYTKVFESDKNLTNKYSGGLGLGSKAAFCYIKPAQKYITISYHEGEKNTYECYRGSDGIPIMDLVKVEDTEETGVEIRIPVSTYDISKFDSAIRDCYMFFRTIPNVENSEVKPYTKTLTELETNEYSFTTSFYRARCRIGNITYEIKNQSNLPSGILIEIPIGDVTIESSREGLSYDTKTISYLNSLSVRIVTEIKSKINELVSKSKCLYEAAILRSKYCGAYSGRIQFNNSDIPTSCVLTSSKVREFAYSKLSNARNLLSYRDAIFVVKDCGSITNRIKQYCYDNSLAVATFVTIEPGYVDKAIAEIGITKDYLVNLSTFKAPKATARAKSAKVETSNLMNVATYRYEPVDRKSAVGLYLLKGNGEDSKYNSPDIVRNIIKALDIKDSVYLVTNTELKSIKSSGFSNLYTVHKDKIANLLNSKEMLDYRNQQILIRVMRQYDVQAYFRHTVEKGVKSFIPFFDNIGIPISQPSYYKLTGPFSNLLQPINDTLYNDTIEQIAIKYPLLSLCKYDCSDIMLSDFVNYVKGKNEAGN